MRKLIPVLLLLAVACKKEGNAIARDVAALSTAAAAPAPPAQSAAMPRMIIRNANISMTVDDTAATIEKITAASDSVGGYVSESRIWRDGEQLRGSITLRIPSDRLSAAMAVIRKLALRINSESLGSQEVTQEYVDLESQLRNLEAAEVELRQLMTTIRRNSRKASEVLEMYQQLANVRAQIEQIKGRMNYLRQMSTMATVQVDLLPNALAKPVVEPGWQPLLVIKNASRALVGALQAIASLLIWLAIYVVPIVILLALGTLIVWRVITVAWKTRRSPSL